MLKSTAFAQGPPPIYFDIKHINETYTLLSRDSVEFYYDSKWNLVRPECAVYIRHTKIIMDGAFNGPFHEVTKAGILTVRGNYENNLKSGHFEEFYKNGSLKFSGTYKNNVRDGEWKLYYEDGSPNLVLYFKAGVPMIVSFWSKDGKQMVTGGNGIVNQNTGFNSALEGTVKDSLMVGRWVLVVSGFTLCKEEYSKGAFVEGTFMSGLPSTSKGKGKETKYQSTKIDFLQEPPFVAAEKFGYQQTCSYDITTIE